MKLLTALAALLPTLLLAAAPAPKPLFASKLIDEATPGHSVAIDVDISTAKQLYLVVTDGGNGFACDWADWAEPRLLMADGKEVKLTDIEWKKAAAGFGQPRINANSGGGTLRCSGKDIPYGIGTHANSTLEYILPAGAQRFKATGALDEGGTKQGGGTSVIFQIYTADPGTLRPTDGVNASHDPADAVASFDTHPGVEVQLFASEPMMASPSSIDIDAQGRVWVCDIVNYRSHKGERAEGDRILIIEDTDHDGKADKSTVFYQGHDCDSAHGICVLGNKALISCGDEVFWLIDDNHDDKADRKEVMFTNIGGAQHDHGIHAFHFGPDGRLYFNHGNAAKQLCDKDGNLITDIHGIKCTNQNNLPYQQGMVYRCDLDGSHVEMLAWNFRNNWEVAVDSFGTMWQSDNDDDGNKSVRINYVMEFGNYGYCDEKTGAGWQTPRIGLEPDITQRHWHQNDPGVIPNVLITGQGSPTGMQVYEGDLLPAIFKGQPLHCDAGPNVVRGYITQPDDAGYKATIENIIVGTRDKWFRPSDVCVAPDGSLIIADWYDPGVGGHGMGDTARGRLFRVTTPTSLKYQIPDLKLSTVDGAMEALKSPNEATRYLAWIALREKGKKAEPALKALFDDKKVAPKHRARALWFLAAQVRQDSPDLQSGAQHTSTPPAPSNPTAQLKSDTTFAAALSEALADDDANLNTTAIRAARRAFGNAALEALSKMQKPYRNRPVIAREKAIALRFNGSSESDHQWAAIALRAKATDRLLIEALGVGADLHWDSRLAGIMKNEDDIDSAEAMRALALRSRGSQAPLSLTALSMSPTTKLWPTAELLRPLRALQLQPKTNDAAVAKAAMDIFLAADTETSLAATALLDRNAINKDPAAKARLDALLKPIIGTPAFVELVQRLSLTGFEMDLLAYILAHPSDEAATTAAKLIAANRDGTAALLAKADPKDGKALAAVLGRVSDRASVAVLNTAFWSVKDHGVRAAMIDALALSSEGGRAVLKWQKEGKLPEELKAGAALALSRSTDAANRTQAAKDLPIPAALGAEKFPALAELIKLKGDATKGQANFMAAGCVGCHQVKGQFINFGPDLSQIGAKLSQDALFTAVLYPSAAIEHSFNGSAITTKAGAQVIGYSISDTAEELTLRIAGGAQQAIKKAEIAKREEMKDSLMPPGLAGPIGPQGLADLVAYLQTLK